MKEEIFKISKDITRAKWLAEMAEERMNDIIPILPKNKTYKIIEEYYEVLVQLTTSLTYADGYKTLSHTGLIEYLSKNYKNISYGEIRLIDNLRKFRHGTVYYGEKIKADFLINHEKNIKELINKLQIIINLKINSDNIK